MLFRSSPQKVLISKLNPIIRGWSNYYSSGVSKETYSKLDHLIWQRIKRWCLRRHSNKSATWVNHKYFKSIGDRNWVFGDSNRTLTTPKLRLQSFDTLRLRVRSHRMMETSVTGLVGWGGILNYQLKFQSF